MTLNLESDSDQRSPERAQPPPRAGKPFWQRPWVAPLAVAVVAYIYLASEPFVGVPKAQAPLQPHENFPLYYPLLIVHMIAGTIAMLTMVLQVWPKLRQERPKVHRVSGRIYVVSVLVSAGLGFIVVWWAPQVGKVGALSLLLFWFVTTIAAYRAVRRGDLNKHRRYMLYSFAVSANNMWAFFALLLIQRFQIPLDMVYYQEAARWIPWVGNVMLVQWWLYRTARRRSPSLSVQISRG
ncbi:MAG: DUF2306 domain-containing protein [Actinophytocola sp.]|uniref:DUF2306 domain-containing protein n=1 Tax=Actinophytocola sp. TaxID=1872138 RepID=UPI003C724723